MPSTIPRGRSRRSAPACRASPISASRSASSRSSATNTVREARMRGARPCAAAPPDRRRSSGSGCRAATGRGASAGRGCVRDSISPSPAAPARLAPSTLKVACQTRSDQARIGRIQPVAAGQRPPGPGVEQHAMMPDQQRRAFGAVEAERLVRRQVAARARLPPPGGRRTSDRAPRHPPPPGSAAPAAGMTIPVPRRIRAVARRPGPGTRRAPAGRLRPRENGAARPRRNRSRNSRRGRSARSPAGSARPRPPDRAGG